MAATIFPLIFKAGIKRDITRFQGEYVEDGDWVRWYHSYLRKMEGIQSYNIKVSIPVSLWNTNNNILTYFYVNTIANNLYFLITNTTTTLAISQINNQNTYIAPNVPTDIAYGGNPSTLSTLPQIIPINALPNAMFNNIPSSDPLLLYRGSNLLNINDNTNAIAIAGTVLIVNNMTFLAIVNGAYVANLAGFTITQNAVINPDWFTGGVYYNNPYLFIYGSNGSVLISGLNYQFTKLDESGDSVGAKNTDGYHLSISTDKVIYGTSTRGQGNVFNMLFWTLSNLVLLTSQDPTTIPTLAEGVGQSDKLIWNKNIISKNISILSSRCVVECDGLFYWPGTDKFYIYNGMVQDLPNDLNQDYFFNGLDMSKRQLVYGVLYSRYKEIWWFYPEKVDSSNTYNIGDTMLCTRALIYNLAEQTWYDTAITGTHGQYVPSLGSVFNLGVPKNYVPINNYLYQFDSTQPATVLNVTQNINTLERDLQGIASSNTALTLDGAGGGNPNFAFDNNYYTTFKQKVLRGNISYTYTAPQILKSIGFLINDVIGNEFTYTFQVIASTNGANSVVLIDQNISLTSGNIDWLSIANNVAYTTYQICATAGIAPLELSELYLYTTSGTTEVTIPINSYFTMPTMSFSSFSPLKGNDGIDNFLQITRVEPDVVTFNDEEANMSMVIYSQTYAQSPILQSQVYQFTNTTPRITLYYQGRQINFGITSTDYFQIGNWFFKGQKGAGQ